MDEPEAPKKPADRDDIEPRTGNTTPGQLAELQISLDQIVLHDCIGYGVRVETYPKLIFPYPAPPAWPDSGQLGDNYYGFAFACNRAVVDNHVVFANAQVAWESHSNFTPPPELSEGAFYDTAVWMPRLYASPPEFAAALRGSLNMTVVDAAVDVALVSTDSLQNTTAITTSWPDGSFEFEATVANVRPIHLSPWPFRIYYNTDPASWFSFHSDFYQHGDSLVARMSGTGDSMAAIHPTPTEAIVMTWNQFFGGTIGIIPQGDGSW